MEIDSALIEAEAYFYDPAKQRYFVKIIFIGTGMFINSFSVQPSKFEGQPLWVQPPKHRQKNGYTATVDFDKSYPLWRIVEQKALEAVQAYDSSIFMSDGKDTVVEEISDRPVSLDEIPF